MKLSEIKNSIATILNVEKIDSAYMRKWHPELCKDKNLRSKEAWMEVYEALCEIDVDSTVEGKVDEVAPSTTVEVNNQPINQENHQNESVVTDNLTIKQIKAEIADLFGV